MVGVKTNSRRLCTESKHGGETSAGRETQRWTVESMRLETASIHPVRHSPDSAPAAEEMMVASRSGHSV